MTFFEMTDVFAEWLQTSNNLNRHNATRIADCAVSNIRRFKDTDAAWNKWIMDETRISLRNRRREVFHWWRRWQRNRLESRRKPFVQWVVEHSDRTLRQAQRDVESLMKQLKATPGMSEDELNEWSKRGEGSAGAQRPHTLAAWQAFCQQEQNMRKTFIEHLEINRGHEPHQALLTAFYAMQGVRETDGSKDSWDTWIREPRDEYTSERRRSAAFHWRVYQGLL